MQSFRIIKSSKHLFLICLLLDIFFIIAAAFIIGMFYPKMIDELVTLTEFVGGTSNPTLEQLQAVQLNQDVFQQAYNTMITYFFLMVFGIYLAYSTLQGIVWKIALKRIRKKAALPSYLRRFFAINLFWLAVFLLFGALYVQIVFTTGAGPTLVFGLLAAFFLYFVLISYVQAFQLGFFKNLKTLIKKGTDLIKTLYSVYSAILLISIAEVSLGRFAAPSAMIAVSIAAILLLEILRWEFVARA